jgi:hypothetical protein
MFMHGDSSIFYRVSDKYCVFTVFVDRVPSFSHDFFFLPIYIDTVNATYSTGRLGNCFLRTKKSNNWKVILRICGESIGTGINCV